MSAVDRAEGYEVREHRGVYRRQVTEMLIAAPLIITGFVLLIVLPKAFHTTPFVFLGLFTVFGIGYWRQQRRAKRWRCPACRLTIRRHDPETRGIRFVCHGCRVVWDTGMDAMVSEAPESMIEAIESAREERRRDESE